ncbi:UNVERIFIED_CONTAM: hypothetical protein Sindi_2429100 [Sesamum indicum]
MPIRKHYTMCVSRDLHEEGSDTMMDSTMEQRLEKKKEQRTELGLKAIFIDEKYRVFSVVQSFRKLSNTTIISSPLPWSDLGHRATASFAQFNVEDKVNVDGLSNDMERYLVGPPFDEDLDSNFLRPYVGPLTTNASLLKDEASNRSSGPNFRKSNRVAAKPIWLMNYYH